MHILSQPSNFTSSEPPARKRHPSANRYVCIYKMYQRVTMISLFFLNYGWFIPLLDVHPSMLPLSKP